MKKFKNDFKLMFWIFFTLPPTPMCLAATLKTPDRLSQVRAQILLLEEKLISGLKAQKQAKNSLRQIQILMKLQEEERAIGLKRYQELEKSIINLEERRNDLGRKIHSEEKSIRKALQAIERSLQASPHSTQSLFLPEKEKIEAPLRKALSLRVNHNLKELAELKKDLHDAEKIEKKIQLPNLTPHLFTYNFKTMADSAFQLTQRLAVVL